MPIQVTAKTPEKPAGSNVPPRSPKMRGVDKPNSPKMRGVEYVVVAPDGGWGWVVVAAAFYCHLVIDGSLYSFGVYMPSFIKQYDEEESAIAWISSLAFGLHFVFGPVAAALCICYGFRFTAIVGSVIGALATGLVAITPPFWVVVLLLGIIRGICLCFLYLPSLLVPTMYFSRYRIHAVGIVMCGTGAGTALFSYAGNFLVRHFEWQTAHVIFAVALLLCAVASLAYRPLEFERIAATSEVGPTSMHSVVLDSYASDNELERLEDMPVVFVRRGRSEPASSMIHGTEVAIENILEDVNVRNMFRSRVISFLTCGKRRKRILLVHPDTKKQIMAAGAKASHRGNIRRRLSTPMANLGRAQKLKAALIISMDCRVLKIIPFLLYCLNGAMAITATIIVFTYESGRLLELGLSDDAATLIIAVLGISNMVWRLLLGVLSTIPRVNYHALNIVGTCLAGVAVLASNLGPSLTLQYCYCVVLGLGLACIAVFRPVILFEIVEPKSISNCAGISMLFSGACSVIGPPFCGWLLELRGKYDVVSWVAGSLLIFSGILLIPYTGQPRTPSREGESNDSTEIWSESPST